MYINSPDVNQIDDDDLFTRPPRSARRAAPALNRCAVCQLPADVLLCRECTEQSERSRSLVRDWLHKNVIRADILLAQWDVIRRPQQTAWERIQDAREQPGFAERCAAHRAAHNVYGLLLDAQAAYEQALEPLAAEQDRLERALEVLEAM